MKHFIYHEILILNSIFTFSRISKFRHDFKSPMESLTFNGFSAMDGNMMLNDLIKSYIIILYQLISLNVRHKYKCYCTGFHHILSRAIIFFICFDLIS